MLGGGGGGDTSGSVFGSNGGGGTGGDAAAAAAAASTRDGSSTEAAAMVGSNGDNNNSAGEDDRGRVDEGDRSLGGNRWPKQETLALLKIRTDMGVTFRDASVKGPLWEEVSRKLAELGYHRSAKKCKEKFENVYKYHKRTKDGRTGKPDGKTYRFFEQLEALENHPSMRPSSSAPAPAPQLKPRAQTAMPAANPPGLAHVTVPSTLASLPQNIGVGPQNINLTVPVSYTSTNPTIQPPPPHPPTSTNPTIPSFTNISADLMSNSTSSSTSSDIELEGRRKRKRKWKDFFERLMKEVIQKQEEMQKKFLEAIEKREHERLVREEAWRMQEMARINREREILAQERSMAATKDAAVMAFLQKLADQQNPGQPQNNPIPIPIQSQQPPPPPAAPPVAVAATTPAPPPAVPQSVVNLDVSKIDNGDQSYTPSSSRWPKVEVEALIKLRTSLDAKYQDSGPKGPLWEEISAAMKRLGYNRNSKRCKEKWENINKYFKKVKESNKKRPDDSKTCPYFHQLDAIYRERNKHDSSSNQLKPENSAPLMVRPEQQWPPPPPSEADHHQHLQQHDQDMESDQNQDDIGDDEEDDEGGDYEIVASKPVSMGTGE